MVAHARRFAERTALRPHEIGISDLPDVSADLAAGLGELPVQMDGAMTSRLFENIVDILSDFEHPVRELVLQICDHEVGGIRRFIGELPVALVVKVEPELPVAPEHLGAADIHDIICISQSSRVAEGADP